MTTPDLVQAPHGVEVSASGGITHLCPFVNEVDRGMVKIHWVTRGCTYELHSLARYLESFSDSTLSHEQLADQIVSDLNLDGVTGLRVEVGFTTAGLEVVTRALLRDNIQPQGT